MRVGFIGLGIMGSRMANRLLSKGFELTVFNRSPEKADALVSAGARRAESPAELARATDVLFTMLSTPEVVASLALGKTGFLEAMPDNALWVDCSTVNPGFARRMAEAANTRGVRHLDAPVAGTKGPAGSGELVFFVGGPAGDLKQCRPLLDCMGKKIVHTGGSGQGAAMKMLFNLMLGNAMAAYSEALVLGQALGFEKETVAEIMLDGPVAAPFLKLKQPLIENGDFEAHFPLRWMRKDLHLASLSAYETDAALPVLNAVKEVYALAVKKGYGGDDFAAIYRYLDETTTTRKQTVSQLRSD